MSRHLALGKLVDYITEKLIVDTVDERSIQKIAQFLVEDKGYLKKDIEVRRKIPLNVDGNQAVSMVDFAIKLADKAIAVIIFGPGLLVTRERSTLAAARLLENYEIPLAVITNGKEAEIMETGSGKIIARGLRAIPSKKEALIKAQDMIFEKVSEDRIEKERRILYVYDVLTERECVEFTCNRG